MTKVHLKDDTIQNIETGEKKDVIVEVDNPVSYKDLAIGMGIITFGIYYLMDRAFRHGCKEYQKAEAKTLSDLGLLH